LAPVTIHVAPTGECRQLQPQARPVPISREDQQPPTFPDNVALMDEAVAITSPGLLPDVIMKRTEAALQTPVTDSRPHPASPRGAAVAAINRVVSTSLSAPVASSQTSGASVEVPPQKLFSPKPAYPHEALAARLAGRVVLRAQVNADGCVTGAVVHRSSGAALLDRAALDAVRRWRFQPARRVGVAVATEILIPIRFTIEDPTQS